MAAAHVVNIVLVHVDSETHEIFTKDGSPLSKMTTPVTRATNRPRTFSTEHRVQPDATIPNSAGYPTIPAYITAEVAAGFRLAHMDQTYIVTQS